ncbi:hypothetical protein H4R20_004191 [Coemansia guatemalensis]|uniref:Uncharacterized protein n=1 Tax=Coemansia guatemalensis TaxID=2761395 RepID=A0A9W8HZ35_9FUNG|nr:hypothetical protein H4R20_004191 [Coemansia guatemalensis]
MPAEEDSAAVQPPGQTVSGAQDASSSPNDGQKAPSGAPSSRFRMAAMGAMQKSKSPSVNGSSSGESPATDDGQKASSGTPSSRFRTAAIGAMKKSESTGAINSASGESPATDKQAPPAVPLPQPPAANGNNNGNSASNETSSTQLHAQGSQQSSSPGSGSRTPQMQKSKLIYDIARTKMLTQRTLYRLSTETGVIKLRSRPTAKATGGSSGASAITGNASEAGAAAATAAAAGGEAEAGAEGSAYSAPKAVVGWKDQGAIDSGKQAPPAAQPSIYDTLAVYVEMVDQSGMWRNCAGVFGLMFLTYVLTALNFGIFGFAVAATYGGK